MALIEIDVAPMTHNSPAKWTVKINAEKRTGHADKIVRNLVSWQEALEVIRRYMEDPVRSEN